MLLQWWLCVQLDGVYAMHLEPHGLSDDIAVIKSKYVSNFIALSVAVNKSDFIAIDFTDDLTKRLADDVANSVAVSVAIDVSHDIAIDFTDDLT